jgi:nitrile hydratase subunit beta
VTYSAGQAVRVSSRAHAGHHRTPGYLKGKCGTVDRAHDRFTNPETRAYGADGTPERRLYLVSFDPRDVWPEYCGSTGDRLLADVFEHWLERVE